MLKQLVAIDISPAHLMIKGSSVTVEGVWFLV